MVLKVMGSIPINCPMNIILEITSSNSNSINLFYKILIKLKKLKNIRFSTINTLNKKIKRKKFTVLKSPHVNKDAREQFEILSYSKTITLNSYHPLLLLILIKYIKNKINSDVSIKIKFKHNLNNFYKHLKSNLNVNNKLKKKKPLNKIFSKNYLKILDIFGECVLKKK